MRARSDSFLFLEYKVQHESAHKNQEPQEFPGYLYPRLLFTHTTQNALCLVLSDPEEDSVTSEEEVECKPCIKEEGGEKNTQVNFFRTAVKHK